jgi:hypothetical protein
LGFTFHIIVESNHTFFEALEDLGRGVFNNNREKIKTTTQPLLDCPPMIIKPWKLGLSPTIRKKTKDS